MNIQDPWNNESIKKPPIACSLDNGVRDPWNDESTDNKRIACLYCNYKGYPADSTNCIICHRSLVKRRHVKNRKIINQFPQKTKRQIAGRSRLQLSENTARQIAKKLKKQIGHSYTKICQRKTNLIRFKDRLLAIWHGSQSKTKVKRYNLKIHKPLFNIFAALPIAFALVFGLNSIFFHSTKSPPPRTITQSEVQKAPKGLFSYGGLPFGDPLVSRRITRAIESAYTDFQWRYTRSVNDNLNSSTASIKMLIDGDLTVAFSARPLNDSEVKRADMRGITLEQTPIAIDGLIFIANNNLSIPADLSLEQIKEIYRGKIKNWNQISYQAGNVPITPMFLDREDISILGLDSKEILVHHVPDRDRLISETISTPGGFSFLSASLIREQQLVKIFNLANNSSSKYVPAFINGSQNLNAFRDGSYPLTRQIFAIYKRDNTLEQNAGEAYVNFLNTKGQKLIKQSGFVPLR